jgi:hypothetical protein
MKLGMISKMRKDKVTSSERLKGLIEKQIPEWMLLLVSFIGIIVFLLIVSI